LGGCCTINKKAFLFIGDAGNLNGALAAGSPQQMAAVPVASRAQGTYAEAGYDVLRLFRWPCEQSLTAFGRFDYVDTQADVPAGWTARAEFRRYTATLGLVYRPILQI